MGGGGTGCGFFFANAGTVSSARIKRQCFIMCSPFPHTVRNYSPLYVLKISQESELGGILKREMSHSKAHAPAMLPRCFMQCFASRVTVPASARHSPASSRVTSHFAIDKIR